MTRGANDTAPMGLALDPDRTIPTEPTLPASREDATDSGPPGITLANVTPITAPIKPSENGTDPGLDPLLKGFNRPPRPPAPQPDLKSSTDGDQFAAHYAGPRSVAAGQVRSTARVPDVFEEPAVLARNDTAPMAGRTPDPGIAIQRDLPTVVMRARKPPLRALLVALVVGALVSGLAALVWHGPTEPVPASVASVASEAPSAPTARVALAASLPPAAAATTVKIVEPAPPPPPPAPVAVKSATPIAAPPAARPAAASPRASVIEPTLKPPSPTPATSTPAPGGVWRL